MKVLVIEDEKKIRDFLVKGLEEEYYEVDTASDGEEGLDLLRLNRYDVVILDNIMPKLTGVEVCSMARTSGIQTPIIILSVLTKPSQKVTLLNSGADDYLAKPFLFRELKARIHALLRRPHKLEAQIMKVADIELNNTTHEVRRGDKLIPLTKKEFMLLRYLMRNKNTVFSRFTLLEDVWDMNVDPFSNTIQVHILSLRKKLGDRKQEIIQTVQGVGYKISST